MGMSPANGSNSRVVMSEINVTPFVDVMLVLLIIFMVTAPMMQQGLDVELPPVPGATDYAAFHFSFTQRATPMDTGVVDGVKRSIEIEHGNGLPSDLRHDAMTRLNITRSRNPDELRHEHLS